MVAGGEAGAEPTLQGVDHVSPPCGAPCIGNDLEDGKPVFPLRQKSTLLPQEVRIKFEFMCSLPGSLLCLNLVEESFDYLLRAILKRFCLSQEALDSPI